MLGGIEQSPRMCYHALSLANHGVYVHFVGYVNSKPHKRIESHPNINIIPMSPPQHRFAKDWPAALSLLLKFVYIFFNLFYTLLFKTNRHVSLIILQNPPGMIPEDRLYFVFRHSHYASLLYGKFQFIDGIL